MAKTPQGATPRTAPPAPPRSVSRALWLLTGILLGGLLTWLWGALTSKPPMACPSTSAAHASPDNSSSEDSSAPTPHFDFYNILPHQPPVAGNVDSAHTAPATVVPAAPAPALPADTQRADPTATPAVPPPTAETADRSTPHATYVLQCGSFHTQDEADQRRAQILLLGLPAHIQTIHIDEQTTWYRVVAGPFADAAATATARSQLQGQNISTITLRKNP